MRPASRAASGPGLAEPAIAHLWRLSLAGDVDAAREHMLRLVPRDATAERFTGPVYATADGRWLATWARRGVLVADATTGEPRRFIAHDATVDDVPPAHGHVRFDAIAGSTMVLWASRSLVFDAATGRKEGPMDTLPRSAATRGRIAYPRAADGRVVVREMGSGEQHVLGLPRPPPGPELSFIDERGELLLIEAEGGELWDVVQRRKLLSYDGWRSEWAVSPDGAYVAFSDRPPEPCDGSPTQTVIVSREDGRQVGASTACALPTTLRFSPDGTRLAVGDFYGRICVLHAPHLAADAVLGSGKSDPCRDEGGEHEVLALRFVDPEIAVAEAPPTLLREKWAEDVARLASQVCVRDGWILPRSLCL